MATFQSTILVMAIIILILILVSIGVVLYQAKNNQIWPPVLGNCPDYWIDTSGNGGNCVNVKDLGTCKPSNGKHQVMDFTKPLFSGSAGKCAKYKWANSCNVTWDGLTYGVTNPCSNPNPKPNS